MKKSEMHSTRGSIIHKMSFLNCEIVLLGDADNEVLLQMTLTRPAHLA